MASRKSHEWPFVQIKCMYFVWCRRWLSYDVDQWLVLFTVEDASVRDRVLWLGWRFLEWYTWLFFFYTGTGCGATDKSWWQNCIWCRCLWQNWCQWQYISLVCIHIVSFAVIRSIQQKYQVVKVSPSGLFAPLAPPCTPLPLSPSGPPWGLWGQRKPWGLSQTQRFAFLAPLTPHPLAHLPPSLPSSPSPHGPGVSGASGSLGTLVRLRGLLPCSTYPPPCSWVPWVPWGLWGLKRPWSLSGSLPLLPHPSLLAPSLNLSPFPPGPPWVSGASGSLGASVRLRGLLY